MVASSQTHRPQGARRLRADIQALRGFAVLIVLCFHSKSGVLAQGYLGVDVFFVISGFVLTGLITAGIDQGRFRLADFYFDRAKRLLPAAYVTFLVTALLAPLFLTSLEMADFKAQMIGAVTFSENFVLWRQSGYFGAAADLKPLLHIWSLAIEEQYYILLPILLWCLAPRWRLRTSVLVVLASIALCVLAAGRAWSFYLLPTRAFELTLGSIAALVPASARVESGVRIAFWPALAALLLLPAVRLGSFHPGPAALLVCAATAVLIRREHPLLQGSAPIRLLASVGYLSYSLYLVHWPLQAFFNNVWLGAEDMPQPRLIRVGLAALAVPLALLLYRYVEQPMHRSPLRHTAGVALGTAAASLGLVVLAFMAARAMTPARDYAWERRINYGFDAACAFKSDFEPIPKCRNSAQPEVLIWGDSYAMHLVKAITGADGRKGNVVQATRSVCGPLLGIALVNPTYDQDWAERCIRFNDSVLAYLRQTASVRIVVLSSPFNQYVNDIGALLERPSGQGNVRLVSQSVEVALAGVRRTAAAVRALGKRVVVVAPPPSDGLDMGRCAERLARGWPILGGDSQCRLSVAAYRHDAARVLDLLRALPPRAGVEVISFDAYLCDATWCSSYLDGKLIYRDTDHLSYEGAELLGRAVDLRVQIERAAR
jgi:peptidoglycan/LPS O-acetylase OafA/YrhL